MVRNNDVRGDSVRGLLLSWLTRLTAILGVLALSFMMVTGTARASGAGFVRGATYALWDGTTLTVVFREAGLTPGVDTTVMVEGNGTVDGACRKSGKILFTTHSEASVVDFSSYPVSDAGTADGNRVYTLSLSVPKVRGVDCVMETSQRYSVTLHDLVTDAVLVIEGDTTPGQVLA